MPVAGARVLRRFKNAILIFLTLLDSATSAQDPTADSVGLKCGEASPGDLLEIQIHGLPPRPTESETLKWSQSSRFQQALLVILMYTQV